MNATAKRRIEDTKTFAELLRIGACTTAANSGGTRLNPNVGENQLNPSFGDDDGEVILWDGQVCVWGEDIAIADALSTLPARADWEAICAAIARFPNNA